LLLRRTTARRPNDKTNGAGRPTRRWARNALDVTIIVILEQQDEPMNVAAKLPDQPQTPMTVAEFLAWPGDTMVTDDTRRHMNQ